MEEHSAIHSSAIGAPFALGPGLPSAPPSLRMPISPPARAMERPEVANESRRYSAEFLHLLQKRMPSIALREFLELALQDGGHPNKLGWQDSGNAATLCMQTRIKSHPNISAAIGIDPNPILEND